MAKRLWIIALVTALLGAMPLTLASEEQVSPSPDPAVCGGDGAMRRARDFLLRDVDNRKWKYSSTKGKVVLIDFWATWCAPCKVEIPQFVELYGRYKNQGFEVVGVSMDENLEAIKSFAAEHGMNYPILIGAGADGVTRAWGVGGLPTTILVTRDGTICRRFVGPTAKEAFEEVIKKLL